MMLRMVGSELKQVVCVTASVAVLSLASTITHAQTGPALMLKPFADEQSTELGFDALVFSDGDTNAPGPDDFGLTIYEAQGRFAPLPDRRRLRFGFDLTYYDIDTNDGALPNRLVDQSFAVGFGVAEFDGWEVGAVLGVGFAGDNPYADSEAFYGIVDLIFSLEINDNSSLQIILDYNGNRSIFPDIPLPAVAYNRKIDDTLRYTVGLPFSSLTWVPAEGWTIDLRYAVPFTVNATIDYAFIDGWHVFGAFVNRFEGFHLDGDVDNRRLFFSQRRLEGGVRWEPCPYAELILACGFAFDQEFERGFDARDLSTVRKVSDEPYLRAGIRLQF